MNAPPSRGKLSSKRRQRATAAAKTSNDVIAIDDSDGGDEDDLNRKPAEKAKAKSSVAQNSPLPCVSLQDVDEENHPHGRSLSPIIKKRKAPSLMSKREAACRELTVKHRRKRLRRLSKRDIEDRELAEKLQMKENMAIIMASARMGKKEMAKSSVGKAMLAVQEIVALVNTAKDKYMDNNAALKQYNVEAVTIDDMVFFAKNMLDLQQGYIQKQIPGYIDVGYHYTNKGNMDNIRTHGLLTRSDRETNNVTAASKGSVFGDGIYTANNETCFSLYGDTGLLVGRLQGKAVRVARFLPQNQTIDANTVIGDKLTRAGATAFDDWPLKDMYHEIVLRSSAQCLPMIKFDRSLQQHKEGKECIGFMKTILQYILDRLFNQGMRPGDFRDAPLITMKKSIPTARSPPNPSISMPPVPPLFRPAAPRPGAAAGVSAAIQAAPSALSSSLPIPGAHPPATNTTIPFNSATPSHLVNHASVPPWNRRNRSNRACAKFSTAYTRSSSTHRTLKYKAPQSLTTGVPPDAFTRPPAYCNMKDDCVICQDPLRKKLCFALNACKHVFHSDCIRLAFKSKPQCPICRVSIGEPQGKSPSGTMTVSLNSTSCAGHKEDSIVIMYKIPSGKQLSYHENPGKCHGSKIATAYLPNNGDGQDLLERLQYSFMHGLSFTVGTSMTTRRADQCTWTSVHHKTSPFGGTMSHGFPDADYFDNCNGELDALGVPSAQELVGNIPTRKTLTSPLIWKRGEENSRKEWEIRRDELKSVADTHFRSKSYALAIESYQDALQLDPTNHIILSNKSAAHLANGEKAKALHDAKKCVEHASSWAKGYTRLAAAMTSLGRFNEAAIVYSKVLCELDSKNAVAKKGLEDCRSR